MQQLSSARAEGDSQRDACISLAVSFCSYVAKATTEMERSEIEVRVARCGCGREVHVAKATTEMKRSGIEVRVARCGRSREAYVAKATTEMKRSGIEVRDARCGRSHEA